MFEGNWTCSICGNPITQLPFEPRSAEGLKCRNCHAKGKQGGGGESTGATERKKIEGNWNCSNCSTEITSLPFEPRDTSNLLCINCYKQKKTS